MDASEGDRSWSCQGRAGKGAWPEGQGGTGEGVVMQRQGMGRLDTPEGHSNSARQARAPEGETLLFANLNHSTPPLPQLPASFWAEFFLWALGKAGRSQLCRFKAFPN